MNILVTGANGFVGKNLSTQLEISAHNVTRAVRKGSLPNEISIGDIGSDADWTTALHGVECVIHCAARAHVMNESSADSLQAYRAVNVIGTRRLAEQAAQSGVRRLVYLSSIKVNGESTEPGRPFLDSDVPAPQDSYATSKWEAEQVLWEISKQSGLEVVIVRPPLVYGPGVKGNFARLVSLVRKGMPLPFGSVNNKRSLVGLDNLVDLLIRCIDHPAATGQVFLVSDGQDLSTSELVGFLAEVLNKKTKLIPVPQKLLLFLGKLTGRLPQVQRLVDSLQVDIHRTCELLEWSPPVPVLTGLKQMVAPFKVQNDKTK